MKKLLMSVLALLPSVLFAQEQVDTLDASYISTQRKRQDVSTQTSLKRIDGSKIGRTFAFMGSPDLIKALQQLPGVAGGTELLSGMYVRGGDGSDNLFLLDGVPMYQVSHLAGLFSSFNTDVIDNVDFYKGGFPARYGDRLSSVVDVTTKEGDFEEYHGNFSLGLIDGRFQLEGPIVKGKTSFNVAVRRTWLDVLTTPAIALYNHANSKDSLMTERIWGDYNFGDYNVKITHKFSDRSKLSANFYNGEDFLKLRQSYTDSEEEYDVNLKWGNTIFSLDWLYDINDRMSFRLTPYYSTFNSDIRVNMADEGTDYKYSIDERVFDRVNDLGVNADFVWKPSYVHNIRFGAAFQAHRYRPGRHSLEEFSEGSYSSREEDGKTVGYGGSEAFAFFEDEISLAERLKVNVGLRDELFFTESKVRNRVEPRISARWQMFENTSLRASYSAMNQFVHQVSAIYLDLPTSVWMPSTDLVKPMHSEQYALGVYSEPTINLSLSMEGFYKTMDHLYEFAGADAVLPSIDNWETEFVEGKGRSFGLEAELEYRTERLEAAAYYTLSWSQRKFNDFYYTWYRDRNDNRHKLTLTATYMLGPKFEVYAGWNYHSGNRVTMPSAFEYRYEHQYGWYYWYETTLYERPNNVKLPDYHRLDLGLNFHRTTRKGNEVKWTVSIYNVYCRMNAVMAEYYTKYNEDGTRGPVVGDAYGLVPVIPSFSYSLKF